MGDAKKMGGGGSLGLSRSGWWRRGGPVKRQFWAGCNSSPEFDAVDKQKQIYRYYGTRALILLGKCTLEGILVTRGELLVYLRSLYRGGGGQRPFYLSAIPYFDKCTHSWKKIFPTITNRFENLKDYLFTFILYMQCLFCCSAQNCCAYSIGGFWVSTYVILLILSHCCVPLSSGI